MVVSYNDFNWWRGCRQTFGDLLRVMISTVHVCLIVMEVVGDRLHQTQSVEYRIQLFPGAETEPCILGWDVRPAQATRCRQDIKVALCIFSAL
jgi:hypothetical protein